MLVLPNLPIMKKSTHALTRSKLYCDLFGHNYKITKQVTHHVKEYQCKCCKRELTTNSNGNLTELTPTFKEINAVLERIYSNKMMRMKSGMLNTSAA